LHSAAASVRVPAMIAGGWVGARLAAPRTHAILRPSAMIAFWIF
jgi:hypothetical protein